MKLKLEKILKRDDGSRVKLTISMSVMYPVSNEVKHGQSQPTITITNTDY